MPQKSYTKDQKVDDEDGHYVVVPEADLTERCAYLDAPNLDHADTPH
jgi:dual-specificity kinase